MAKLGPSPHGMGEAPNYNEVVKDNQHGTGWKPVKTEMIPECECGQCKIGSPEKPDIMKPCPSCGRSFCESCEGYRAMQTWRSKEGNEALYGYHPDWGWELWAN